MVKKKNWHSWVEQKALVEKKKERKKERKE